MQLLPSPLRPALELLCLRVLADVLFRFVDFGLHRLLRLIKRRFRSCGGRASGNSDHAIDGDALDGGFRLARGTVPRWRK